MRPLEREALSTVAAEAAGTEDEETEVSSGAVDGEDVEKLDLSAETVDGAVPCRGTELLPISLIASCASAMTAPPRRQTTTVSMAARFFQTTATNSRLIKMNG
jgi:hypothetical protein